jgi:Tol biopolymer transport system component
MGFAFAAGRHCAVLLGVAPAAAQDFSAADVAVTARPGSARRGDRSTRRGWMELVVLLRAVALGAGLLLVATAPAAGASAGANGKIVFVSARDHPDSCTPVCIPPVYEIYVANADGSSPTRLTHDGRGYSAPTFSPDGTRIAYSSGSGHLFVMDADGTDSVQLTSGGCGGSDPAFSPDGSRIAYVVDASAPLCPPEERGKVAVMDADGDNRIVLGHLADAVVWAPDGSRIAFTCGLHICTMTPAGGDLRQLTHGSWEAYPNYSPEGSRIVYMSVSNHIFGVLSEIYVMDADGSDPRRLTFNDDAGILFRALDAEPEFSPDGKQIAYSSTTHGNGIHVMNADGTGITLLSCPASGSDRVPDWGPLVAPSDAGSGVICDADFDDDGVANPSDTCPYVPGPIDGLPPGCPRLSPAPAPVRTPPPLPPPPGSIGPAVDDLPASVARELAQAGRALARCGTTGLLRRAGCRDSFTALGPGFVVYRVVAPAADSRAAAVAVIASGKRAIPSAGSYPVKVKATKKGRKSLRKARKLRATLTVTFTDSTGNVAKRSKRITLKRKKK